MQRDYVNTALELLLKDGEDTRKLVLEILARHDAARDKLMGCLLDLQKREAERPRNS